LTKLWAVLDIPLDLDCGPFLADFPCLWYCVTVVKSYDNDDVSSTSSIEYEQPTADDHHVTSSVTSHAGTRAAPTVNNDSYDEEIYEDIEPTDPRKRTNLLSACVQ